MPEMAPAPSSATGPSRLPTAVWIATTSLLFCALATALWFNSGRKTSQPDVSRFEVDLGSLQIVLRAIGSRLAISPDGRTVVMTLHGDTGKPQLYVRRL